MFDFKDKIAVVTGGARGIGKCIREKFEQAGATVCVIDILDNDCFVGDLEWADVLETTVNVLKNEIGSLIITV